MAERGIAVDHSTVHRRALKLLPILERAFRHCKRAVGKSWRMDETYIRIGGEWKYLYRAVDKAGNGVDFCFAPVGTRLRPNATSQRPDERRWRCSNSRPAVLLAGCIAVLHLHRPALIATEPNLCCPLSARRSLWQCRGLIFCLSIFYFLLRDANSLVEAPVCGDVLVIDTHSPLIARKAPAYSVIFE